MLLRVWLQVASFGEPGNAQRLVERLESARVGATSVQRAQVGARTVYRVRLGPFESAERSRSASERLQGLGLGVPTLIAE